MASSDPDDKAFELRACGNGGRVLRSPAGRLSTQSHLCTQKPQDTGKLPDHHGK